MLGKIIGINENLVEIALNVNVKETQNLINLFVLLSDGSKNFVGEIVKIKDNQASVNLVGEFVNNNFVYGISNKPSFKAQINLISPTYINKIIGLENEDSIKELYLGNSLVYPSIKVGAKVQSLFSHNFAIVGSSGSGKSCGFATMIQNLFRKKTFPKNASFVVIDSFGEYEPAFRALSKDNDNFVFKSLTTNKNQSQNLIKIPVWLLSIDDLALLLNVKNVTQMPVLEKALKFVDIFAQEEEKVLEYKTSIIAKALLEILASGRASSQIRDQFFSVLTKYNTRLLNLDSAIAQPGYIRPLKQCLLIDETGKIRAIDLVNDFLSKFIKEDIVLKVPDKSYSYTLDDIAYALEFALIDEGILRNEKLYNDIYYLKTNLDTLRNSSDKVFFEYSEYISETEFMQKLLYKDDQKCQILNININFVDDRLAKMIAKIYSKLLYDFCRGLKNRASVPVHIVLEEAHRYVQNDNDVNIIGYNIFERIAKEGRKYGILIGLITQRPSELSETALSQCSNFLMFKMIHPEDLNFISHIVPDITEATIQKMKTLQPGNCILFGTAFKLPTLIKMAMPNPSPMSSNCDILGIWYNNN